MIASVRKRNDKLPIFVVLEQGDLEALPLSVTEATQEYVFLFEDTPSFIAGRIDWAWRRYAETLLPPYFQAMLDFYDSYEYSMHTQAMPEALPSGSQRWVRRFTTSTVRTCSVQTCPCRWARSGPWDRCWTTLARFASQRTMQHGFLGLIRRLRS